MEETSGFYRLDADGIYMYAQNFVFGPDYTLMREDRLIYDYPTNGNWYWFDTQEEANLFFDRPNGPEI